MLQVAAATVVVAAVTSAVLAALDSGAATPAGPLRLYAYTTGQPGTVLLRWTEGYLPSDLEYNVGGPAYSDANEDWREFPRKRTRLNEVVLSGLETGVYHLFKIRERGDATVPAVTVEDFKPPISPVAAQIRIPKVRPDGYVPILDLPLAPGRSFWLRDYGVSVTVPSEGEFVVDPDVFCREHLVLWLTLPTDDGEMKGSAFFLALPLDVPTAGYARAIGVDPRLISRRVYQMPDGRTLQERAEHHENPHRLRAARLLNAAIESMFGELPPVLPEAARDGRECI